MWYTHTLHKSPHISSHRSCRPFNLICTVIWSPTLRAEVHTHQVELLWVPATPSPVQRASGIVLLPFYLHSELLLSPWAKIGHKQHSIQTHLHHLYHCTVKISLQSVSHQLRYPYSRYTTSWDIPTVGIHTVEIPYSRYPYSLQLIHWNVYSGWTLHKLNFPLNGGRTISQCSTHIQDDTHHYLLNVTAFVMVVIPKSDCIQEICVFP